jgi:hypothetical protein
MADLVRTLAAFLTRTGRVPRVPNHSVLLSRTLHVRIISWVRLAEVDKLDKAGPTSATYHGAGLLGDHDRRRAMGAGIQRGVGLPGEPPVEAVTPRPLGSVGDDASGRIAAEAARPSPRRAVENIGAARDPDGFAGDARALLMSIYRDPRQPISLRIDAAKAALPFERPRLAAVERQGVDEFGDVVGPARLPADLASENWTEAAQRSASPAVPGGKPIGRGPVTQKRHISQDQPSHFRLGLQRGSSRAISTSKFKAQRHDSPPWLRSSRRISDPLRRGISVVQILSCLTVAGGQSAETLLVGVEL